MEIVVKAGEVGMQAVVTKVVGAVGYKVKAGNQCNVFHGAVVSRSASSISKKESKSRSIS